MPASRQNDFYDKYKYTLQTGSYQQKLKSLEEEENRREERRRVE